MRHDLKNWLSADVTQGFFKVLRPVRNCFCSLFLLLEVLIQMCLDRMNQPSIFAVITLLRLDQTITTKQKLVSLCPKAARGNFTQNLMTNEKEYRTTVICRRTSYNLPNAAFRSLRPAGFARFICTV